MIASPTLCEQRRTNTSAILKEKMVAVGAVLLVECNLTSHLKWRMVVPAAKSNIRLLNLFHVEDSILFYIK